MSMQAVREEDREKERLERIAALTDPATIRYIEGIGIAEGWRCAEVGAGAGSIARWLANRVGQFGKVEVIDITTEYLRDLEAPNVEVRQQDIVAKPLDEGAYDLVHAKILLMHLPEREKVLQQFAAALKPGGYLIVEECDIRSIQRSDPPSPLLTRAAAALETFFYFGGADPGYGMKLLPAVRRTVLQVLGTDCQLTAVQAWHARSRVHRAEPGQASPDHHQGRADGPQGGRPDFELLEQPSDLVVYTPITVSVWAQRPD